MTLFFEQVYKYLSILSPESYGGAYLGRIRSRLGLPFFRFLATKLRENYYKAPDPRSQQRWELNQDHAIKSYVAIKRRSQPRCDKSEIEWTHQFVINLHSKTVSNFHMQLKSWLNLLLYVILKDIWRSWALVVFFSCLRIQKKRKISTYSNHYIWTFCFLLLQSIAKTFSLGCFHA